MGGSHPQSSGETRFHPAARETGHDKTTSRLSLIIRRGCRLWAVARIGLGYHGVLHIELAVGGFPGSSQSRTRAPRNYRRNQLPGGQKSWAGATVLRGRNHCHLQTVRLRSNRASCAPSVTLGGAESALWNKGMENSTNIRRAKVDCTKLGRDQLHVDGVSSSLQPACQPF